MTPLLLAACLSQAPLPGEAAGTWADPARAVFLEPGARSLLSGLNAFSLDGLQPAASSLRYDGVTLRLPAHGFLGPGTLPASWLSGLQVESAAGTVDLGRTLGRTITLLPRQRPAQGLRAEARLDVLSTGVTVHGVVPGAGTEVLASARFFTVPALAASRFGIGARLGDWQLRVSQPVGEGTLRLLALGAVTDGALTFSGIPLAARIFSQLGDVRWLSDGAGTLEVGLTASHDSLAIRLAGQQVANDVVAAEQALGLRAAVRPRLGPSLRLEVGGDAWLRRLLLDRASRTTLPSGGDASAASRQELGLALSSGLFVALSSSEGPFRWSLGARGDAWRPADGQPFFSVEPRASAAFDASDAWTVEASAGLRHQPATWLLPVPVLDTAAWRYGLQQALVADAAVRWTPATAHALRLRAFGTRLFRSVELTPLDERFLPQLNFADEDILRREGDGWAGGAALTWTYQPSDALWVRASYSLVASYRTLAVTRFGDLGAPIDEVRALVPWAFDQAHLVQAAVGFRPGEGWLLAATLTAQTGAPLAGGLFSQEQRPGTDSLTGAPRWVPVDRDRVGRSSPWLRLDVRASKQWQLGPVAVELFLDVQNASVWAQPTGTSYGTTAARPAPAPEDLTLTSRPAASPLGFPLPVLGVEARL